MKTRTVRWLVFGILMLSFSAAAYAQIGFGISVRFGPPAIPIYEQPPCPGVGYLWTPGYWAWSDDDGYFWVPGTWVIAPVGMYWTPGYWGWAEGVYLWHDGYWGPHVGFYGGINYGFGYTGEGFYGGEWRGRSFYYNREVMNVRATRITNVYSRTVVVNNYSHVSFNGGEGGISARPNRDQERFARERHVEAIAAQKQQMREASHNRALFARENNGRPSIAATAKPGDFKGHVVAAREAGGAYHPPAVSPREARVKPGDNRQAERNQPARGQEQRNAKLNRNAEANRNAENHNANREESRANAKREAEQQKAEQRNQQKQAQQQRAEQQRNERQQADQRKNEQKNAQRQQAQQQKAEQQRNERQQAEQRKNEQKNAQRQQAQQQKADQQRKNEQKNAQRQQAQAQKQQQGAQKAEQRQAQQQQKAQQREQKEAQKKPQPGRGGKPDKGPGR